MLKKYRSEKTFALSLALHLLMLLSVSFRLAKPKPIDPKIEIALLETPKKKKAPPPPTNRGLKMVSQDHSVALEKELRAAKYFSERNQKVEKETKAINHGQFKNSKGVVKEKQTVAESDIVVKKASENPQPLGAVDDEDESATDEHIVADQGLVTLVNSKAFKYYTYCKRIKDKIQLLWEPQIKAKVVKQLREQRQPASKRSQDKTTKAIIILDAQGTLEAVQIIGKSGLEDMDATAVEAFRAAAPFPNPPLGIIDPDGKIRIRWDFVLSDTK